MVPLTAPPATLQVTAEFDEPVTVAVNCCVFPTDMVTGEGDTETAMGVVGLDVPAQPHNRMQMEPRPPRNIRCCMDCPNWRGGSPFQKQEVKKRTPTGLPIVGLHSRLKRCLEEPTEELFAALKKVLAHSISRQLSPTQTSTSSGTESL
jgi:hypothetical protein